ncbi:NAD(P)H-dependent oxidoreductase [Streptomyces sp. 21So2-11]|uniref:NADPH-dependent FMN reductase n=1 Tax=Streptomyces sp. 21So2-11 TaxID=3144408 RepID=UPI00321A364D
MARIALMSGSLRRESVNSSAVATVQRIIERRGGHTTFRVPLRNFPLFDEDTERVGGMSRLWSTLEQFSTADALFISSPSYNGYPPGVLKNALDWLSLGGGNSPLTGIPAAIASASPGRAGGANVQPHLRLILANCGARVIEHEEVAIGNAPRLRGPDGLFVEPGVVGHLERLVDATLAAAAATPVAQSR